MTATSVPAERPVAGAARRGHHPRIALAIIATTQLMVVLDATIVNIALPHVQSALHFSTTGLSWVLNAYTLTFGGLLLLGGRAGDILGRRRVFVFGILLFGFASFLGGLATTSSWLLAARALQGVGGAIASPTALSLITTNFAEGAERNRAFGVFAAVSGSGAAIGLLAGGMLTSWLSWRWVLFVNIPIGLVVAIVAPLYVNESEPDPGQFDLAGAVASTAGMSAVVYGFIRAAQEGWRDPWTIGSFGAAVVLLAAFIGIETRTQQPITPLHMLRNPDRSGSYAVMLCLAAALFSLFFFLTLFVQNILGYSPLKSGLAFLPVSAMIGVTAQVASRRLLSVGPKPFMVAGAVLATGGLAWLSRMSVTSSYAVGILGPMLLFAAGMGFLFVPLTITAVNGVDPREAGAASGLLNAMEQVGGSLGLAILVTVFGTASRNEGRHQAAQLLAHGAPQMKQAFAQRHELPPEYAAKVLAHGISTALGAGVVFTTIALVVSVVAIRATARTGSSVTEPVLPEQSVELGPGHPGSPARSRTGPQPRRRRPPRLVGVAAGLLVIGGIGGGVVAQRAPHRSAGSGTAAAPATPSSQGAPARSLSVLPLVRVSGWDPRPDGDEHDEQVGLSHDGDPGTAWFTEGFATSDFSQRKPGVGLLVDLGSVRAVSAVRLLLAGAGVGIQLRAADRPSDSDQGYQLVRAVDTAPRSLTVLPPRTWARYWLVEIVRLARLPAAGEAGHPYRAGIAEMSFLGT